MTNSNKGKLSKVTIEYENEIHTLSGETVIDWINAINNLVTLSEIRGHNPFKNNPFKWQKVKIKTND